CYEGIRPAAISEQVGIPRFARDKLKSALFRLGLSLLAKGFQHAQQIVFLRTLLVMEIHKEPVPLLKREFRFYMRLLALCAWEYTGDFCPIAASLRNNFSYRTTFKAGILGVEKGIKIQTHDFIRFGLRRGVGFESANQFG